MKEKNEKGKKALSEVHNKLTNKCRNSSNAAGEQFGDNEDTHETTVMQFSYIHSTVSHFPDWYHPSLSSSALLLSTGLHNAEHLKPVWRMF